MSNRGDQWKQFSKEVLEHIETYAVPQYGDMPEDEATSFTEDDIKMNLRRYTVRIGQNARGEEEAIRDCYKIAHYACLLAAVERKEKK